MTWKENSRWIELVDSIQSIEHYKAVVQYMFADNVVNHSRVRVLYIYTKDVCSRVNPLLSQAIWRYFKHFLRSKNIRNFQCTNTEEGISFWYYIVLCIIGIGSLLHWI